MIDYMRVHGYLWSRTKTTCNGQGHFYHRLLLLSSNQRMYQPLTYHKVSFTLKRLIIYMEWMNYKELMDTESHISCLLGKFRFYN
jgi:hypothetical protein